MKLAKRCLGSQIWIEREDSKERINEIFSLARESGLGWVRIFLLWPWIEPSPDEWDFRIWDDVFDAAKRYDIFIKATLTANSPPWHVAPQSQASVLHSHNGFLGLDQRPAMERYIQQCVKRYFKHPALGQWVLWNEPSGGHERTPETLHLWHEYLRREYAHDVQQLNRRWLTGYASFEEIPFPENIPHPIHQGYPWVRYAAWLLDYQARASWLQSELQWIADCVRDVDDTTPFCLNPSALFNNHAAEGHDLSRLGKVAEFIGASYHPAWAFLPFAQQEHYPAMMAAGIRLQLSHPSVRRVEITEVQTGSTFNCAAGPTSVTPDEIARFYLAGLAAGAESVTGWLFNTRSQDFEAGDWALLDNCDQHSPRSRMIKHLHDRLEVVFKETGAWAPAKPAFWIGHDPRSQALEWVETKVVPEVPGRGSHDGMRSTIMLASAVLQRGHPISVSCLEDLPKKAEPGQVILLSHLVAWESAHGEAIYDFAKSGGIVVIDALCGRKNFDAALHRPWPGGLATQTGFYVTDLSSRQDGWSINHQGQPLCTLLGTRSELYLNPLAGWHPWSEFQFAPDDEPLVWERNVGQGRLIIIRGLLGGSLVHRPETFVLARLLLDKITPPSLISPSTKNPNAIALPVTCEHGQLTVVLDSSTSESKEKTLLIEAPSGEYQELWTGQTIHSDGVICLNAHNGIALLFKKNA